MAASTFVKFLEVVPFENPLMNGLEPTPSVSDVEYITGETSKVPCISDIKELMDKTHKLAASYRGVKFYLTPNCTIYRHAPLRGGANQYTYWPQAGDRERVRVTLEGVPYNALAEFTAE